MILHAEAEGQGSPLVLLHGLFGSATNFRSLARRLATEWRVIRLDLRNHGASGHAPLSGYSDLAGDVLETLDSLGMPQVDLLGHSMGGKVAMALTLLEPARVARLIVADIAPIAYAHHNAPVGAALLALPLRPGLTRAEADLALAATVPDAAVRSFLLQNLRFGDQPVWRIGLAEIAAAIPAIEGWPAALQALSHPGPALFLRGSRSDYIEGDAERAVRASFPAAMLQTIDNAGHWLHADQHEAFLGAVRGFLLT